MNLANLSDNPYRTLPTDFDPFHIVPDCDEGSLVGSEWFPGWPYDWGPSAMCRHTLLYRCLLCNTLFALFEDYGNGFRRAHPDVLVAAARREWFPGNAVFLPAPGVVVTACDGRAFSASAWYAALAGGHVAGRTASDEFLERLGLRSKARGLQRIARRWTRDRDWLRAVIRRGPPPDWSHLAARSGVKGSQ